jgi:hypothetical protein
MPGYSVRNVQCEKLYFSQKGRKSLETGQTDRQTCKTYVNHFRDLIHNCADMTGEEKEGKK